MGKTPLHLASSVGNLEAVQYLVEECHADPYARDKEGLTAIDTADRHEYVVEWLKNVDNNPNTYVLK
jgi:ankyrin repeat protein